MKKTIKSRLIMESLSDESHLDSIGGKPRWVNQNSENPRRWAELEATSVWGMLSQLTPFLGFSWVSKVSSFVYSNRNESMEKAEAILIVEDEKEIRELLADMLSDRADKFFLAENGVKGLAVVQTEKLNLILTDLAMPQMNGFELIRRVRADKNMTPIIVITGHGDKAVANQLKALISVTLLSKPFSGVDLHNAVTAALEANRAPAAS
ncbi:MAG: response regulator [Bdellovibrionales bacterium]|nr:response regulator [Bdellovibrionales bacterium]